MSLPANDAEKVRADATMLLAEDDEVLVSTACPECGTRFAVLGRPGQGARKRTRWHLRCTLCPFETYNATPKNAIEMETE